MPKRTLAVLGVVAFAGLALPFGLPQTAQAAGTIASISLMPFPIAQPGTLTASTPIAMCVQPRNSSGGIIGVGVPVWLSFYSGLFTAPLVQTSTALVGSTPLTTTPASFLTVASCTSAGGTSADSVAVSYTAPTNPIPAHGRDVLIAADSAVDSGTTGACPGTGVCNNGTYVYSPVTQYAFAPVPPIAPNGSLAAGAVVNFTVTAEDSGAHAAPGAFLDLSLSSTASPNGSATGFNHFSGFSKERITNTPQRFGTDNAGAVQVAYTAASAISGVDTITAQDHPITPTALDSTTYTYGSTVAFTQAPYTAVTPFRVCDTRPAGGGIAANQCNAAGKGPITQGQTRAVTVTGGLVPGTATAIVVNLTAIAPTNGTFVKLFPAGGSSQTSNVNPQAGQVVANLAEVAIGTAGQIDVFNAVGTINVALDVEGYVDTSSLGFFNATAPTRICDTRAVAPGIASNQCNNSGAGQHPIGPGVVLNFNVTSSGSPIPNAGVTAVVFNLTAIGPTARTVLTAYPGPTGSSRPNASNINLNAGQAVPNRVIVPVPSGCTTACTVNLWNAVGFTNVAVDVDGWFGTAAAAQFTALTPARVCDTQSGTLNDNGCNKAMIPAGGVLNINVTGIDGLPVLGSAHSPIAVVVNVTAVNATSPTFVTVYAGPFSVIHPTASDLNAPSFEPVTNLVVAQVGSDGTINLFNAAGNVNLIVDVFGYYS
jgi:hypothetical protein